MSRDVAAATRKLLAAAMNARTRLGVTDADLAAQLSEAIGAADQALREHEIQEMQNERRREQIRTLAREARGA